MFQGLPSRLICPEKSALKIIGPVANTKFGELLSEMGKEKGGVVKHAPLKHPQRLAEKSKINFLTRIKIWVCFFRNSPALLIH